MTSDPWVNEGWELVDLFQISGLLEGFGNWVLCGGRSVDLLLGRQTRSHGDTDVGIFRSDIFDCLSQLKQTQPYLCDPPGHLVRWQGQAIDRHVYDVWLADRKRKKWVLQLMVFDDDAEFVFFKRNRRIKWNKAAHSLAVDGLAVLNPWITLLYKSNQTELEPKDVSDIVALIEGMPMAHPIKVADSLKEQGKIEDNPRRHDDAKFR